MNPKFKINDIVDIYKIGNKLMIDDIYLNHCIVDIIPQTINDYIIGYHYVLKYKNNGGLMYSYPEDTLKFNKQIIRDLKLNELGI